MSDGEDFADWVRDNDDLSLDDFSRDGYRTVWVTVKPKFGMGTLKELKQQAQRHGLNWFRTTGDDFQYVFTTDPDDEDAFRHAGSDTDSPNTVPGP